MDRSRCRAGTRRLDRIGKRRRDFRLTEEDPVRRVAADRFAVRVFGRRMAEQPAVRRCVSDDECPFKTVCDRAGVRSTE
jgi:hypothetical protein